MYNVLKYKKKTEENVTTPTMESHTTPVKGMRKAKMSIAGSPGFCIIRLMLKSMNGLLKSIRISRSAVIVMGPSAISFFCKRKVLHLLEKPFLLKELCHEMYENS